MHHPRALFAVSASLWALGTAWYPACARAQAQTPPSPPVAIRPSKLFTTEFADTLPIGTHLLSVFNGGIEVGLGLPAGFQLDLGGNFVFAPAFQAPLYGKVKQHLWTHGFASVGWGALASTTLSAGGPGISTLQAFLPITLAPLPGLLINVAPKLGLVGGLAPGVGAGAAYFVNHDLGVIAEGTLNDFAKPGSQQIVLGVLYLGFGPRSSLLGGLILSGGGASLVEALAIGF